MSAVPRVAVLLATYNGAAYVGEQLASLAAQSGVDLTIFFADDGSRDATVGIVRASVASGLRVREITGPRAGTAARNFARLLASAPVDEFDYVAFADQDDRWLPDKLARAAESLRTQGAQCYASNMTAFYPTSREVLIRKDFPQRPFDHLFQSASAACTYVLTRDAARMVGAVIGDRYRGWSDDMSFDCVVYAATRSRGLRWVIDARPTILYRQHTSNVFGANVGWRAAIMRVKLLRRGWIRQHVRSIAAYCESSPAGDEVVRRVQRGSIGDRVWLFARAGAFRRESRARLALRAFFLLGWF